MRWEQTPRGTNGYEVQDLDTGNRVAVTDTAERAHLIAAAPELLAVAEAVADHFADTDAPLGARARAAIAKARGEGRGDA